MTDLFISYNSHDEIWARRFFHDITSRFPMIKPFWAREIGTIPPGVPARQFFESAARDANNFVVFWSSHARDSNEVGPEIQSFEQSVLIKPQSATGAPRKLFHISLEKGVNYGGLADIQGYSHFQNVYKAEANDRGIAGLSAGPERDDWSKMVREIANEVLKGLPSQPITLAPIVVTTHPEKGAHLLDPFLHIKEQGHPSLSEFLQSVGLSLEQAKERYGSRGLDWRPFGTDKTIIDLAEDVRERVNQNLETEGRSQFRFHWEPIDFATEANTVADYAAFQGIVEKLLARPSVVVTDPISLFHPLVKNVFSELARKSELTIVSIYPVEAAGADQLYLSLWKNGNADMRAHLRPEIPAGGPFAFCGLQIQHIVQIEPLIRNGLSQYYLQRKKAETKLLVSSGI